MWRLTGAHRNTMMVRACAKQNDPDAIDIPAEHSVVDETLPFSKF